MCVSPATAADCPAMITLATPGPAILPGWLVVSPILAAIGIVWSSFLS
jgi:hypothetical protein